MRFRFLAAQLNHARDPPQSSQGQMQNASFEFHDKSTLPGHVPAHPAGYYKRVNSIGSNRAVLLC